MPREIFPCLETVVDDESQFQQGHYARTQT
jgi:hypothetical protein